MRDWVSIDVDHVGRLARDLRRTARSVDGSDGVARVTSRDPASREVVSLLGDLVTAERAATEAVVVTTNDLATALEGVVGDVATSDTFAAGGTAGMVR